MTVLQKLIETRPNFQPGSEDWSPRGWALSPPGLDWIDKHAKGHALEIGCGWSTCVLAEKCEKVFSCDVREEKYTGITAWLQEHFPELVAKIQPHVGPSTDLINTAHGPSQPVEFLLVDGLHAYPLPQIDWFFGAQHLMVGGYVMLDDRKLWSAGSLIEFLKEEPEWLLTWQDLNTAVFRLIKPFDPNKGHRRQPYLMARSSGVRGAAMRRAQGGCAGGMCSSRKKRPLARDGEE